jgi:hypothetical protein
MPAPTFLGIGAQKAGTTWLFSMIAQHPEVCSGNRKELHYFNIPRRWSKGREWYEAQFTENPTGRAVGECTPAYLWTDVDPSYLDREKHLPDIAGRVAGMYPGLRLVVCLRHPVSRARSAMNEIVKKGPRFGLRPGLSIREAASRRPSIVEKGRYAVNLTEWMKHFPREAFLVLIYERDILPDAAKAATLRRVFEHIGVAPSFQPVGLTDRKNVRLKPYDIRVRYAGRIGRRALKLVPPAFQDHPALDFPDDPEGEQWLWSVYEPEIRDLEDLLGQRLLWNRPRAEVHDY